ncbi:MULTISPECIES: hypothetical protein [unclassified Roseivivax]|uniref:hypothetical protein n=1 Tax=Roseivivax sp. GX 12232 TaxID=2900547 RepID=UPI001E47662D|nr:hypothetical protein [Roseivivax sp. GX 12232]MCE0506926.1 hypothetical protein [Roseivivax sp. GX 12232]
MRTFLSLIAAATLASAASAGIPAPDIPNLWFPESAPTVPAPQAPSGTQSY